MIRFDTQLQPSSRVQIEEPAKVLAIKTNSDLTQMLLVYETRLWKLIDMNSLSTLHEGRIEGSGGLPPPMAMNDGSFIINAV